MKCRTHKDAPDASCRSCYQAKYQDENAERLRLYRAEYYKANKAKILEERRLEYLSDPKKKIERSKAYFKNNEEKMRAWHKENRARLAREQPEILREASRAFRKKYPERKQASVQARRARIAGVGGKYTIAEWRAILERYRHTCPACGVTGQKLTVDHVIPIARGGTNDPSNLQPLCKTCNNRKNAHHTTRYEPWQ